MFLSIIIPIYNVEKYLSRCLDSVVSQCCKNIEIILVNDGSTDKSEGIAKHYLMDDRVKYVYQENRGLSEARNRGLGIAVGDYVLFLDSDDSIELNTFEELSAIVDKFDVDIVVFGRYFIKSEKEKVRDSAFFGESTVKGLEYLTQSKLKNCFSASACNKIYKRSFLQKNNLKFKSGIVYEDLLFNFQCFSLNTKVYVLNTLLYNYYVGRIDSIINSIKDKDLDVLITVRELCSVRNMCVSPIPDDIFYMMIYDWISNAVSYKYPRIALFNWQAISIVRSITRDSEYEFVLLYCANCRIMGLKRQFFSWLQINSFWIFYFLVGIIFKIKKIL